MKQMHNIEKSAFKRRHYVGYGRGQTWRIHRDPSSKWWTALSQQTPDCTSARTLGELSEKLGESK